MPEGTHHAVLPDDLWEYCGRTSAGVVTKLYRLQILELREAQRVEPEPEPEPEPERPVSGTLIVTSRRTRCPLCREPVERNADAVMMDGTEYGYGPREAFHVHCAEERGWRRAGTRGP